MEYYILAALVVAGGTALLVAISRLKLSLRHDEMSQSLEELRSEFDPKRKGKG